MSHTETCAACEEPIDAGAAECLACGNNPSQFIRNAAVGMALAGMVATIFHVFVGVVIIFVGISALVGIWWKDYPAAEYDF